MSAAVRCDGCGCYADWPPERREEGGPRSANGDMPRGWARILATSTQYAHDHLGVLKGLPADVCSAACAERVIGEAMRGHRERLIEAEAPRGVAA